MSGRESDVEEYVRVAEFRAALRRFARGSERAARHWGLTPQRYQLLLMIKGAPSGDERSTVTELVGRAEEAGLVQRAPSAADGRVAHLRLTAEGERLLGGAFAELEADRQRLAEAFHLIAQRL